MIPQKKYLCAYIVSAQEISISGLREHLAKKLPKYMIPTYFIKIDEVPLTANGKRDIKALPEPDEISISNNQYEIPANEMEQKLAEMWQEILNVQRIGVNDNLIELGASSINIMRFVSGILKEYGVELSIRDLLYKPTIRQCALQVIQSSKIVNDYSNEYTLLNPETKHLKNIFCFPPLGCGRHCI